MKDIFRIENVSDYNNVVGVETLHPLVSVIDMSKIKGSNRNHTHLYFGVYAIFFKESDCGEIGYGRGLMIIRKGH